MPNAHFIEELDLIVQKRLHTPRKDSYTATLAAAGIQRVAQKVGEEAVELALASIGDDRVETINEAADLIYHLLVLLNVKDISLSDVAATLEARHKKSQPG